MKGACPGDPFDPIQIDWGNPKGKWFRHMVCFLYALYNLLLLHQTVIFHGLQTVTQEKHIYLITLKEN